MTLNTLSISETLANAKRLLAEEKTISPALKAVMEVILVMLQTLMERMNVTSQNSSKPPSQDPHRKKKAAKNEGSKNPGGQQGHVGKVLAKVETPDEIQIIDWDKAQLPVGEYEEAGYCTRQVIDLRISRHVIEYRAQILKNQKGQLLTAAFPDGVGRPVQYGQGLKANVVYQSMFQLVPYNRIEDYFANEVNVKISQGSIYNFNKEAYEKLERFESFVKQKLIASPVLNGDETGINIKGKGAWLHLCANERFTYFFAHQKRGREAMDAMDVLPNFQGVLCHDHWRPYFIYTCAHALCNAHHLRELTWAHEQAQQTWAGEMKILLMEMNKATQATGTLTPKEADKYYEHYRAIIAKGKIECPLVVRSTEGTSKRGRVKQSKARNLLDRLSDFETETLRFAHAVDVPFTNNLAENNIRMTKVQQKISGCFRSLDNAQIFCRIRSYISTCRKHGIAITEALKLLFDGKDPPFMRDWTG